MAQDSASDTLPQSEEQRVTPPPTTSSAIVPQAENPYPTIPIDPALLSVTPVMAQNSTSNTLPQNEEQRSTPLPTTSSVIVPQAQDFQPAISLDPPLFSATPLLIPLDPEDEEPQFDYFAMARDAINPVDATVPGQDPEGESSPSDSPLSSARSMSLPSFPPSPDGESQAEDDDDDDDNDLVFYDTPSPRSDADDEPLFDEDAIRRNADLALAGYGLEAAAEPHVSHEPNLPAGESNDVPQLPEAAADPAADSSSGAIANAVAGSLPDAVANAVVPPDADFDIGDLHARLDAYLAENPAENPSPMVGESSEPAGAPIGPSDAPKSPISDDLNISLGSFDEERDLEPAIGPDPPTQASTSTADQTPAAIPVSVGPVYNTEASSGSVYEEPRGESATEVTPPIQASTSEPEPIPAAIPMSTDPVCELNASCNSAPEEPVQVPLVEVDRPARVLISFADLVGAMAPIPIDPGLKGLADKLKIFREDSDSNSEDDDTDLDRKTSPPTSPTSQTQAAAAGPADQVSIEVETVLARLLENCYSETKDVTMSADREPSLPTPSNDQVRAAAPVPTEQISNEVEPGLSNLPADCPVPSEDVEMDVDSGFSDSPTADLMTHEAFDRSWLVNPEDLMADETWNQPSLENPADGCDLDMLLTASMEKLNLGPPSASGEFFVSGPVATPVPSEDHDIIPNSSLEYQYQIANEAGSNMITELEELKEQYRQELQAYEARAESWKANIIKEGYEELAKREADIQQEAAAMLDREKAELEKKLKADFDIVVATQKQDYDNSLAQARQHADDIQAEFAELQRKIEEQHQMLISKDAIMEEKEAELAKQKHDLTRNADLLAKKDRIFEMSRANYVKNSEEHEQSKAEAELVENELRSTISRLEDEQKRSSIDKKNAEIENLKNTIKKTGEAHQDLASIQEEIAAAKVEFKKLEDQQAGLIQDLDNLEVKLNVKERRSSALETQQMDLKALIKKDNVTLEDIRRQTDEITKRYNLYSEEAEEYAGEQNAANYGKDKDRNGSSRKGNGRRNFVKNDGKDNGKVGPALPPVADTTEATEDEKSNRIVEGRLGLEPIPLKWLKVKSDFPTWWVFALILLMILGVWLITAFAWYEAPVVIDPWKVSVWSYHAGDGCGMSVPAWLWEDPQLELSGNVYG